MSFYVWTSSQGSKDSRILCDSIAKKALLRTVCKRVFIDWGFPFENISLVCGGHKNLVRKRRRSAHKYVHKDDSNLIYWKGWARLCQASHKSFAGESQKICECNGCNRHLSPFKSKRFKGKVKNKCPTCGSSGESIAHVPICPDLGHSELFTTSVADVTD